MMRKMAWVMIAVALCSVFFDFSLSAYAGDQQNGGTVTLSGAWALYPLAVRWAEEFQKVNPGVRIEVAAGGAGKGMADCLADIVDIGMVSRQIYSQELEKGAWPVAVAKDAVVATINSANPLRDEILSKGFSRQAFVGLWIDGTVTTWQEAVSTAQALGAVNVYTRSDSCGAAETWAGFLGGKQEDLRGVGVYGDPGLAEAVRRDANGIGYNNVNYAYDAKTKKPIEGIEVVPLDIDGSGAIEESESFYGDRDQIMQAIADNRYPSPPARELYFVCHQKPVKKEVIAFLTWVLTEGQRFAEESGYIAIRQETLEEELRKLGE